MPSRWPCYSDSVRVSGSSIKQFAPPDEQEDRRRKVGNLHAVHESGIFGALTTHRHSENVQTIPHLSAAGRRLVAGPGWGFGENRNQLGAISTGHALFEISWHL